jgi:hypothetical protein
MPEELSFKQWLRENGYKQLETVRETRLSLGADDDEIEELETEYEKLEDQYCDECFEQGYPPVWD